MPKYTENQLEQAVNQAVATGNIKGSAEDWDVPSSTLQDRLKGLESNPTEQTQRQRLTPEQEVSRLQIDILKNSLSARLPEMATINPLARTGLRAFYKDIQTSRSRKTRLAI